MIFSALAAFLLIALCRLKIFPSPLPRPLFE
jgi:hypothetical protein